MNPLLLMILTVLANAIVTGIIVYRLQKKIDITYQKQMEEFRASVQYSNFEQQTKFASIHAKRVETLETLYQKFVVYTEDFQKLAFAGERFLRWGKLEMEDGDFEKNTLRLDEWWVFLEQNRLFLPVSLNLDLRRIYVNARTLDTLLPYALPFHDNSNLSVLLEHENEMLKVSGLKVSQIDLEKPDFILLLSEINLEMSMQRLKLENLYKSVADIADKETQVINKKS